MTSKHSSTPWLLNEGLFDGLVSFGDIEARISALPGNKGRGDAFEIFAEAYLATQKIAQAQEVWPFEAVPLAQRQALSLDTGRDMGVDGTYLTVDGELRAYQVKFRSNRPSLTWDELSTFMGLTDQVSQRVLFTNCETLPSLMQDRSGFVPIRGSDLDRLTAEDFEAMRQWLQTGQVTLPRKRPLPHQQEALTTIAQGLQENDRATVVMACGTGKSLVSLWAAEAQEYKTILVLVPSLALVRQLLHEWLRETAWERLSFMCVCSDPTVAKRADDLIVHQADLVRLAPARGPCQGPSMPGEYAYTNYLRAKKTVDDRALNKDVFARLRQELGGAVLRTQWCQRGLNQSTPRFQTGEVTDAGAEASRRVSGQAAQRHCHRTRQRQQDWRDAGRCPGLSGIMDPTHDLVKAIEAIGPAQARPVAVIGERPKTPKPHDLNCRCVEK